MQKNSKAILKQTESDEFENVIVDAQGRAWREAHDSRSGKVYYYDAVTRESRWDKPQKMDDFYSAMEANIRRRIREGEWSDSNASQSVKVKTTKSSSSSSRSSKSLFRTLSSVDDMGDFSALKRMESNISVSYPSPIPELVERKSLSAPVLSDENTEKETSSVASKYRRSNTTSTVYVPLGTMSVPDQDATIQCVCTVFRAHMLEAQDSTSTDAVEFKVFNSVSRRSRSIPELSEVVKFMKELFTKSQMESECIIMTLIYVERLIKATEGRLLLLPQNWKPILFCSMVMASKIWDDLSMWNGDFSKVCPQFSLKRINELELAFLNVVEYSVKVSASSYAKYYFQLRGMCSALKSRGNVSDSAPLDLKGAREMQILSERYESDASSSSSCVASSRARSSTSAELPDEYRLPTYACLEQMVSMDGVRLAGGNSAFHRAAVVVAPALG